MNACKLAHLASFLHPGSSGIIPSLGNGAAHSELALPTSINLLTYHRYGHRPTQGNNPSLRTKAVFSPRSHGAELPQSEGHWCFLILPKSLLLHLPLKEIQPSLAYLLQTWGRASLEEYSSGTSQPPLASDNQSQLP